ncbi:hypothetical protein LTS18_001665, partial [Coniosporium uncinatum]
MENEQDLMGHCHQAQWPPSDPFVNLMNSDPNFYTAGESHVSHTQPYQFQFQHSDQAGPIQWPVVHEGFVPRQSFGFSDDFNDSSAGQTYNFTFNNGILGAGTPFPNEEENGLDDDELPPIQSEAIDVPLDADANNATLDPDYSASEAEAQGEEEDSESDREEERRAPPSRGRGRPRGRPPKSQGVPWVKRPRVRRGKIGRPRNKERSPGPEYKSLVGKAVTSRIEE